ncbi:MAG: segregation ATPase FtsK/SpoIIIE, family [Chloroflexota bacterium]|jgi:S-DNA-T family DNA segregation ATPase FtsK/SpoIIIE|nr:segregation ATPase FtsK/SpoIIIE, family [Chloroflexota bacterium]
MVEAWLSIQAPDGKMHDLAVRFGPATTGRSVAEAVARELGLPDKPLWSTYNHRAGCWTPPGLSPAGLGLRHGDVLGLVAGGRPAMAEGAPAEPAVQGAIDDTPAPDGPTVEFNRQPRVTTVAPATHHRVPAPPRDPGTARLPLATALVPLLLGGAMVLVTHSLLTLALILLSPVLAMASYAESRLGAQGEYRRARREFEGRLDELVARLRSEIAAEVLRRHDEAPGLERLARAAHLREPWLWERRPRDPDFLAVRVGLGTQSARTRVDLDAGGSDRLREPAEDRVEAFREVAGVPIVASLASGGPVALAGAAGRVPDLARWLVLQAACHQSPRNLTICAAIAPAHATGWEWLRWLPHTDASSQPIEGPLLCAERTSACGLLGRLVDLLDARHSENGWSASPSPAPVAHVLAVLDGELQLPRAAITRLLVEGPGAGIDVLWVGSAVRDLPNECRTVVDIEANADISFTRTEEGSVMHGSGRRDRATAEEARQLAMELAPLRDTSVAETRARVPSRVALASTLGLPGSPSADDIAVTRLAAAGDFRVALGATAHGPFQVDLRRDGPHVLVAGTTGAGKSELLRSLVVGLAAAHPPSKVTFLLVDYKGGSAFREAVRLPHTVGLVTDLDDHLAARALVSLRAEVRRREEVLRCAGARDLADLELRAPDLCPPSLVIVVDEFATLAREVPAFVDGIVDLAQRGRSLGLHLVLATQRPAGVVSENIRANTNLRIALRMSADAESLDVIGVPDAARLSRGRPGRAFARTGHGEIVEFQAAYSGLAPRAHAALQAGVTALGFDGPSWPAETGGAGAAGTHLQLLVGAIADAHARSGNPDPDRPWLDPLPELLASTTPAEVHGRGLSVVMGMTDLPERQRREPWVLDFARDGNLLVYGTGGSGKSSLLRHLAWSLTRSNPTRALHLYAMDCGGGDLAALLALPHCGAVVRADETERMRRLVRWLRRQVDVRRAHASASAGAAGSSRNQPAIVVLVDGYSGFVSAMEKVDLGRHVDALPRLVADGAAVGVHFVLTAGRRADVPGAVSSAVPSRLVLRMADDDEYRLAGVPAGAYRGARLAPGRGFTCGAAEVQCAVLGRDGTAESQLALLRESGAAMALVDPGSDVPGILLLPDRLDASQLAPPPRPLVAMIGLSDWELSPAALDLAEDGQLVVGPTRSGRSTALGVAAASMHRGPGSPRLVLLAPRRTPLTGLDIWDQVAVGIDRCDEVATQLAEAVQGAMDAPGRPVVVVVDDGEEVGAGPAAVALEALARRGRDRGVRLLAAVETRAAHRAYTGWIAEMRKARQGLLLQPDVDLDGDLLGARLPRHETVVFPPGRAFMVQGGQTELVQLALPATSVHERDQAILTPQEPHQRVRPRSRGHAEIHAHPGRGARPALDDLTLQLAE